MKIKVTPSAVIVPRWLWFAYFTMTILGADHWPEAVGGVLMLIVGLRMRLIDGSTATSGGGSARAPN